MGKNGQRDQLRVRVLERSARGFAVILEEQDVFEAPVFFQIENAVAEGPEHIFNALRRQRGQGGIVVGRLDDDLVRADAVHLVEHAFGLAVQSCLRCPAPEICWAPRARSSRAYRAAAAGLPLGWDDRPEFPAGSCFRCP